MHKKSTDLCKAACIIKWNGSMKCDISSVIFESTRYSYSTNFIKILFSTITEIVYAISMDGIFCSNLYMKYNLHIDWACPLRNYT